MKRWLPYGLLAGIALAVTSALVVAGFACGSQTGQDTTAEHGGVMGDLDAGADPFVGSWEPIEPAVVEVSPEECGSSSGAGGRPITIRSTHDGYLEIMSGGQQDCALTLRSSGEERVLYQQVPDPCAVETTAFSISTKYTQFSLSLSDMESKLHVVSSFTVTQELSSGELDSSIPSACTFAITGVYRRATSP